MIDVTSHGKYTVAGTKNDHSYHLTCTMQHEKGQNKDESSKQKVSGSKRDVLNQSFLLNTCISLNCPSFKIMKTIMQSKW